jgi:hypothetical protein
VGDGYLVGGGYQIAFQASLALWFEAEPQPLDCDGLGCTTAARILPEAKTTLSRPLQGSPAIVWGLRMRPVLHSLLAVLQRSRPLPNRKDAQFYDWTCGE